MAKQRGSCLRKLVIGCGSIVALFILGGLVLALTVIFTQPTTPQFEDVSQESAFSEQALDLGSEALGSKPILLEINASKCRLIVVPDGKNGQVQVDGSFDTANYRLKTNVENKKDHIHYSVDFDTTRTVASLLFGGMLENTENTITVHVPSDRVLALEVKASMGESSLDLTGLQVESMDLRQSMGEFKLECLEPNPIEMDHFYGDLDMGQYTVVDLQNLRVKKVKFEGARGEALFAASGPLLNDLDAKVRFTMGEASFQVDEDTVIDDQVTAFMGAYQGIRKKTGTGKSLKLRGSVTMGEISVRQGTYKRSLRDAILRVALYEGSQSARDLYFELKTNQEKDFDFRESELNRLGYDLLRRERTEDAIDIFKLNLEEHPEYANGYDSLGEAYYEAKQWALSEESYRKALELDPDFHNAQVMLRKLQEKQRQSE